jgi:tetratricopeptide (TPR) repeat protein
MAQLSRISAGQTRVFVSYSRSDQIFTVWLRERLALQQIETFRDIDDTLAGEEWWQRLQELIAQADTIIFVVSPHSIVSKYCASEIRYARRLKKRIFPVIISNVDWSQIPDGLASVHSISFENEDAREETLLRLVADLKTNIGWIREHTRLGLIAARWQLEHSADVLLRGHELETAETWLAAQPENAGAPTGLQREYIKASRNAARQRRHLITVGLAVALFLALTLASTAVWQKNIAETQRDHAEQERGRAERNLAVAKRAVKDLIFNVTQGLSDVEGLRIDSITRILGTVRGALDNLAADQGDDLDIEYDRAAMLNEFAMIYHAASDDAHAVEAANEGLQRMRKLAERVPDNLMRQKDLSVAMQRQGDMQKEAGNTDAAIDAYTEGLAITRKLVERQPDQLDWYEHLSVALQRIAAVRFQAGDETGALEALQENLKISRKLVDEGRWHSGLAIVLNWIGEVELQAGKLDLAKAAFDEGLIINQTLAQSDPGNTKLQVDLAIAFEKIGDLGLRTEKLDDAEKSYDQALEIWRRLASQDSNNGQWQRGLSVLLWKSGDLQNVRENPNDARRLYEQGLLITRDLWARNPRNISAEMDIVAQLGRIGEIDRLQGDAQAARKAFDECLEIASRATNSVPANADYQRSVMVFLTKLGEMETAAANADAARRHFAEGIEIGRKLLSRNPNNPTWRSDLAYGLSLAGALETTTGNQPAARVMMTAALSMFDELESDNLLTGRQQQWLVRLRSTMNANDSPRP